MELRRLRMKAGLTQISFATLVGVTQSAASQWESGLTTPGIDKLPIIAKVLRCSIDDLLDNGRGEGVHDTATAQVDPPVPPAAAPEALADRPAAAVPAAGSASGGVAGKHADVPPWVSTDGEDDGDMSWLVE